MIRVAAEHAFADHARREVDKMLLEHHEKLYSKGMSSSIQPNVESMNVVVVTLPLSGETVHRPPEGGWSTLNGVELCANVSDPPSLESMSFNLYVPGLKSKSANWSLASVDFWRIVALPPHRNPP